MQRTDLKRNDQNQSTAKVPQFLNGVCKSIFYLLLNVFKRIKYMKASHKILSLSCFICKSGFTFSFLYIFFRQSG